MITGHQLQYREVGSENFTSVPIPYTSGMVWITQLKRYTDYEVRLALETDVTVEIIYSELFYFRTKGSKLSMIQKGLFTSYYFMIH